MCASSMTDLELLINSYSTWALTLGTNWGGLTFITPAKGKKLGECGATWSFFMQYVYLGPETDSEYTTAVDSITSVLTPYYSNATNYANWYLYVEKDLEVIIPIKEMEP
jgi:hypothetical protein